MATPNAGDALNWQLVTREYNLLRPSTAYQWEREYVCDRRRIQVAVKSPNISWNWAGYLNQYALTQPSTTTEFVPLILLSSHRILTRNLQIIELADYNPRPWLLQLRFPYYFKEIQILEIWKYLES